jgi:NADPH-dependent 7-cyano-7-deazaguanine reductase QueF
MINVQPRLHDTPVRVCHSFDLPRMCPVSGNPQPGSVLEVWYTPDQWFLEIETLGEYIANYIGGHQIGRAFIRDMEQTIQQIAADCAASVGVRVVCVARLKIADDPAERARVRDYRVIARSEAL